ncbi:MAG: peptidoglycan DD-metalloendopeptidase family protein [Hyphomonadaceae bacterium]
MTRAALLLALMAGACATSSPAPIAYGTPASSPATPPSRQAPAPAGETPAIHMGPAPEPNWADGEGTPLSAYALRPEEAQPFDPSNWPRTHTVGADESLYDIATRYQAPLRALIDQNRLEPPYALAPGRVIELPPPRIHIVARGEDFEAIARRYNVDLRSLALLNRMRPPYAVRRGERIVLPAMAREYGPPAPSPAAAPADEPPAIHNAARFAWPLRGDVVARFGAQPGGTRLDGIEIAGREGAEVVAAAEGDVFYAGADIEGLGNLVLVRHTDNYVTAYGYNRRALVREGQHVRAGEPIAELGLRPDGRARLLFQVRRGSEALDPAPLLGTRD